MVDHHLSVLLTTVVVPLFALSSSAREADTPEGGLDRGEVVECRLVKYYTFLAKARRRTGDHAGAGAALRQGIEIAPKEASGIREEYARWLETDRKPEEALRYTREASDAAPDNIALLTSLQGLLGGLNKWDEEAKVTERIDELETLYRPTVSSELRFKK